MSLPVLVFVPSFPRTYDSRLTFRAAWDLPRSSSRACSRRPTARPFFFLPFFDTVLLVREGRRRGVIRTEGYKKAQTGLIRYVSPCILRSVDPRLCPGKLLTIHTFIYRYIYLVTFLLRAVRGKTPLLVRFLRRRLILPAFGKKRNRGGTHRPVPVVGYGWRLIRKRMSRVKTLEGDEGGKIIERKYESRRVLFFCFSPYTMPPSNRPSH